MNCKEAIIGIILGGIAGGIAGEFMRKFIVPRYPKLFKEGDFPIDIIIKYFKKRKNDSSS
ncbi:MAG: hypothetical protein LBS69_11070 [Prevotellaceae bacterium]|nr:hypothetical protein [Prevotellaceae bacterium]